MTKIAISPNPNGTGTFTIAAPNSNTDRTLTLPDAAGEVLTDTSDIEAQVKTATSATGTAPIFACRAWVNFNGIGTVAIRASGNVSSITDHGLGDYTVNFTTAMQDASYAVAVTPSRPRDGFARHAHVCENAGDITATSLRFRVFADGNTVTVPEDSLNTCVAIFR